MNDNVTGHKYLNPVTETLQHPSRSLMLQQSLPLTPSYIHHWCNIQASGPCLTVQNKPYVRLYGCLSGVSLLYRNEHHCYVIKYFSTTMNGANSPFTFSYFCRMH